MPAQKIDIGKNLLLNVTKYLLFKILLLLICAIMTQT
jgi:hypothetical protein